MEDIELSPEARREQRALHASTERIRAERIELEKYARELEALVLRKEEVIRRQQELLAEIQVERQSIKTDYEPLHRKMTVLLR